MGSLEYQCKVNLKEAIEALSLSNNFNSIISPKNEDQDRKLTLVTNSKCADHNSIFIALPGTHVDGHEFLSIIINQGTNVAVVERWPSNVLLPKNLTVITVSSTRLAWSTLCALACGDPQKKLNIVGVTGTNGKTSVVWMIRQLLNAHQIPNVAIGTLGVYFPNKFYENLHTTPDPDKLFPILKMALDDGIKYVIMEVSSHSLVQKKLAGITFSTAIFTSFSRDHLDFHKDLNDYFSAKLSLFEHYVSQQSNTIICTSLGERTKNIPLIGARILYGFERPQNEPPNSPSCFIKIQNMTLAQSKILLEINEPERIEKCHFEVPYFSHHALENFCAAFLAYFKIFKVLPDQSKFNNLEPVPGRLEIVKSSRATFNTPVCIVDYAHTPDALEKTLLLLKSISSRHITVVFGCGGNRDGGKRPLMGKIAAKICDHVFITSDNPRHESPLSIINEIYEGIPIHLRNKVTLEIDRAKAINLSIRQSTKTDPPSNIVIAGKGHETFQIIGDQRIQFEDQKHARAALDAL